MSFNTISQSSRDVALQDRITAGAMQEAIESVELAATQFAEQVRANPMIGLNRFLWPTCTEYEAEYASALAGENPNPGADEGVITDGNIRSVIQKWWPVEAVRVPQQPIFPLPQQ